MSEPKKTAETTPEKPKEVTMPKCGIVMPISAIDGLSADHWLEVLSIIKESVTSVGFEPNLVSDADEIGIIQTRIIQNLYNNEIVVCDVSSKNPNVMFELGLRLAFDKATIIIKDDKTDYSFDTSVIEHLTYPRDLRFHKILLFKESLAKKVESTFKKSQEDENYSTFLKNFGQFKISQLSSNEVTSDKYILTVLEELRKDVGQVKKNQTFYSEPMRIKLGQKEGYDVNEETYKILLDEYLKQFVLVKNIKVTDIPLNRKLQNDFINFVNTRLQAHGIFLSDSYLKLFIEDIPPF